VRIIDSKSVLFIPTTVQKPNLALIKTKRITVHAVTIWAAAAVTRCQTARKITSAVATVESEVVNAWNKNK